MAKIGSAAAAGIVSSGQVAQRCYTFRLFDTKFEIKMRIAAQFDSIVVHGRSRLRREVTRMSADSDHSMGQPAPGRAAPGRAVDWEPADLAASEEPDWYADDALTIDEPAWETPDLHDPPDEGPPQGAPFVDGGWADTLAPDPVLATLVDLV